jgi:flagellar motor switch protein FliM
MANEVVPYIIVKELLEKLSVQLLKEHDKQQHE